MTAIVAGMNESAFSVRRSPAMFGLLNDFSARRWPYCRERPLARRPAFCRRARWPQEDEGQKIATAFRALYFS